MRLLNFGRVVDATALERDFGYRQLHTTDSAYASFVAEHGDPAGVAGELVERLEQTVHSVERAVRHG
jgi:hypothetical protein